MTTTVTEHDTERIEELSGRLFMAGLEALELLNVDLGLRLGLYTALDRQGASTSSELAATAGIAERYAGEWLEQQAVTGVLDVDDTTADADAGGTRCPSGTPWCCSTPTARPTPPHWRRSSPKRAE